MSFMGTQSIMIKDQSGNVAPIISGVGLAIAPTLATRFVGSFVLCTSGSGGVPLTTTTSSMPYGITVKNINTYLGFSGLVHVGSEAVPPYISGGYLLNNGEELRINTSRPDLIRVYGRVSGMLVTWNATF